MLNKSTFICCGVFSLFLHCAPGEYWNASHFVNGRESRRIRNKLVTFDTTETDIEVAFQFNVPFIAVPSDRSLNDIKNSIKSLVNLNLGSVALAGTMLVFGSIASFLWKLLIPTAKKINPAGSTNQNNDKGTQNEPLKSNREHDDSTLIKLMNLLEESIKTSTCIQQFVCSTSRASAQNVASGYATSTDKIIDGIFSASWIIDMIENTAIHDAIRYGVHSGNCYQRYDECGASNLDELFDMLRLVFSFIDKLST